LASRLLNDAIDTLQKTVKTKKTDAALSLLLDSKALTLLAGTAIADGAKLDKNFRELVDVLQKNGSSDTSLKANAESYNRSNCTRFPCPRPIRRVVPLVGDTLEVVTAVVNDKLLVAAGREAGATLKKAIDQTKSRPARKCRRCRFGWPSRRSPISLRSSRSTRSGRPGASLVPTCARRRAERTTSADAHTGSPGRPRAAGRRRGTTESGGAEGDQLADGPGAPRGL